MLLVRIHAGRQDTAFAAGRLASDLRSADHSRRSIQTGLDVIKASLAAAGVIWSLNAISHRTHAGRSGRLFTFAISLLSSLRVIRKAGAILIPMMSSPPTRNNQHEQSNPGR